MSLLERVISIFAPHECIVCGSEGELLCHLCSEQSIHRLPERCFFCNRLSPDWKTCKSCRSKSSLRSVVVCAEYAGVAKELIYLLKFQRAQAAARPISEAIADIAIFRPGILIVPVPTATSRRRQRGYDQSELIARRLAELTHANMYSGLYRHGQARQVGTKRQQRHRQLADAFWVARPADIAGKSILLIDDVATTGSTLEAAAKSLRTAGAARVDAAVFAKA